MLLLLLLLLLLVVVVVVVVVVVYRPITPLTRLTMRSPSNNHPFRRAGYACPCFPARPCWWWVERQQQVA